MVPVSVTTASAPSTRMDSHDSSCSVPYPTTPTATYKHRKRGQQLKPANCVAGHTRQSGLPRPRRGQQHRGEDRQQQQRQQRVPDPQAGGDRRVGRARRGQPDRGEKRGTDAARAARADRCRRGRRRRRASSASSTRSWAATATALPRKTPPGIEAGEPQPFAGAVGDLDGRRALHGEHRAEHDGQPEQTGRRAIRARRGRGRARTRTAPGRGWRTGAICWVVTRERRSIRRSLPATSAASRNTDALLFRSSA